MDRLTLIEHYIAELESSPYSLNPAARLAQISGDQIADVVTRLENASSDLGASEDGARFILEASALALFHERNLERASALLDRALSSGSNTPSEPEVKLLALAAANDVEGLYEFFGQSVENLPDSQSKSRLYYRMGQLLEFLFEDLDEAKNAYVWANDLDASNLAALWGREDVALKAEDYGTYAELLYNEVNSATDVYRQLDALVELGEMYRIHLQEPEAAAQCFASVFEADPGNERARAGLLALGYDLPAEAADSSEGDEELSAESQSVEQSVDELSSVEELTSVDELSAAEITDEESDAEELAEEPEGLGESDDVISAPEDLDAPDFDLGGESEASEAAVATDSEASEVEDMIVEAEASEAESAEEAAEAQEAEIDEIDVPAPSAARAGGSWRERMHALLQNASSKDGDAALLDVVRAARLQARHNESKEDAIRVWREAIALGIEVDFHTWTHFLFDATVLESILEEIESEALKAKIAFVDLRKDPGAAGADWQTDLEEGRENWRKFQRTLEGRWADLDKDEQAQRVYMRMADVAAAMDDSDKEMDALRRLDRQLKDDRVSRYRLQEIYKKTEKWPMYVDLLKTEAAEEEDTAEKIDILEEMVSVYRDHMNHDMMVVNTYKEILELEPANIPALDALVSLYDKLNRSTELINTLQTKAELVETTADKVEIHSQIAKLFLEKFRNQAEAIKSYETVLELDPVNADAIEFLKEMYEKRREWDKLIEVHRREIDQFESDAEKAQGLKLVAELATDKLRKPDVAAELWIEVRKYAPEDPEALESLEKLYEKTKEYEALADILEVKARLESDPEAKLKLLGKLAPLYSDRLENTEGAIAAWRVALELAPDDLKARKSLERLFIDNQRWDDLESFYAESDSWAELVRLLETLANTVKEEETKVELLLRAARVWREELEDTSRAERDLDRVLQIDAQNVGAAELLEPIYSEAEEWEKLKNVCEVILAHRSEVAERQEYQLKLAKLYEEKLDSVSNAFAWFAAAFRESPNSESLAGELERTAGLADQWPAVVGVYEIALEEDLETSELRNLKLRLGRVLSEELDRLDEALEYFASVVAEEPENQVALKAMADIYQRSSRWDDLMGIYQRQIELTETPSERVEILSGMALIAENQAMDKKGAIKQYLEALAIDPNYEPGLQQLHRLYREEGEWENLAGIIRREIVLLESVAADRQDSKPLVSRPEALLGEEVSEAEEEVVEVAGSYTEDEIERLVSLRYELGTVCKEFLNEPKDAIENLGRALAWEPNHREASQALETYLDEAEYSLEVAKILEPAYEVHGDWEKYIQVLEVQIEGADEDLACRLIRRVGDTYLNELGQPAESFSSFGRLLRMKPEDAAAQNELVRIADALDAWEDLVGLYEDIVVGLSDEKLKRHYHYSIAEIYAERLHDADRAQSNYEAVLEIDPEAMDALDDLEQLFTRTENWDALRGVLERELELAESAGERETLRTRIGLIWEEKLEDRAQAISIYSSILEDNPSNLEAIESVNRLYAAEGKWDDLAASLRRELALVDGDAVNGVKNRLASVLETHLNEYEQATDLYEEVVDSDEEDSVALAALERLLHDPQAPQYRISEIVEPLYLDRDEWTKLIGALEVRAKSTQDAEERVAILTRIAAMYEIRSQDPAEAFMTYARALHEGVEHQPTYDSLYRLADSLGGYEALVEVFERESEVQESPDIKRSLLRRAATIYRDKLGEIDSATARLHEVLEIFPSDIESVEELETLYRNAQNWDQLVPILTHKSDLVDEVEAKRDLLRQAGLMLEEFLERPEEAIEVYQRALEVDSEDLHSIGRLEVLYRDLEAWEDLLKIYNRKVDLLGEGSEERKDLYYAMADIHRNALIQPHEAIDVLRKVLEIEATEVNAWVQLDELYEQTEQWNELLETLEAELMLVSTQEESNNVRFRIGRLWETHLFDIPKAIETYREVLSSDASHEATTQALEGLISQGENAAMAGEVLEPIYRDSGEWNKLIHVWRLLIEASEDVERKLGLYNEIGSIFEHKLYDSVSAFETYAEALKVDAGRTDVLNTLERLAAELEIWPEYIEQLDARIEDLTDFDVVRNLQVRIARVYEEELHSPQEAIARFRKVLEGDPSDDAAIAALDRLYQREGEWAHLAEILQTRIMNSQDPDEVLGLRLRLGQLYQSALEDENGALEVYQTILMEDPENPNAIASLEQMFMSGQAVNQVAGILEPYYSSRGQHSKLVEIYVQRLEMLDEPEERYDVWMLVARTFLEELGDSESALASYGKALVEKPSEESVVSEIMRLSGETDNWQAGAQLLIEALDSPQIDEESSAAIFLALAKIYDTELGFMDRAEQAYLNVLSLDSTNVESLRALDRIYDHQGRWEELSDIISRRIQAVYDEEEIVELNFRLAGLYQTQLGDLDSSISTYETILDIQPGHVESLMRLQQIFYQLERWESLYDVLGRYAEAIDDPEDRADTYTKMAQISEAMLNRPEDSVDLWNQVLQLRDDDVEALQQLRKLYLDQERWTDLVGVLEREVELTLIPEDQLPLYESLGVIWADKLGNEGQSLECWKAVLEIDSTHLGALESLRDLYERNSDHVELMDVDYRLLQHPEVDSEMKLALWEQVGEVQGDVLMQTEKAIEAWKHVLAYSPGHERALDSLERLYLDAAEWEAAAEVLEMKLDHISMAHERIELLLRIADIWETKIVENHRAASFYEQILQVAPTNEQAGTALENIYRTQGTVDSYQALATLYLDRADHNSDDPELFLTSRRASARVFEQHLGQLEGAFLVLVTAFRADTIDDESLLDDLERLASQTGQWADLVGECQKVLSELPDSPDASDLHQRVGLWLAEHLNQLDDAVYHYQRALMLEPDNVEIMDRLENLYRQISAWPELAMILKQRVELTTDPDEQMEIWRKLGELFEMQMGQVDEAIESYREILRIDPADLLAIESLERIFEAYDRWESLIEILNQKASATYDPDEIVEIRFRVAQIWEDRLGNTDEAIATYQQVIETDQSHSPSLAQLERLYLARGTWNELLGVYEQQLQLTHEPDEQVAIYGKMASLQETQFDDLNSAVESYNNILTVAPDHLEAITNLERLYRGQENWFDLAEILLRHADVAQDAQTQAHVLNELGIVQRDQIQDPNAAIEAFTRSTGVLRAQPDVWLSLANLYDETANWYSAIPALQEVVELSSDNEIKVDTLNRIGFMYEANLQDDEEAENAYNKALHLAPAHEPSILALRDLFQRRGDSQGVIRVLKQAEDVSRDLSKKADYLCQIGKVYETQLNDSVSATHYFEQALENDPSILEAARPLIDMYMAEKRWERAHPLLEQVLNNRQSIDGEESHRRSVQMARVSMELGQGERALQAYRDAYEMDPTDTETLKGLSELLYRRGEWEQSFKIFQALTFNHAASLDADELRDIYYKSGDIKQRVGERRKAIQMYQKALEYDPQHAASLHALVESFEAEQNWQEVINTLRYLLQSEREDTVRFAHLSRIGDIWLQQLSQSGPATEAYLEALDVDPESALILRKLLDIYTKTSQWPEAVDMLRRLIEREQDAARRSKYLYTVGVILRDEIRDRNGAVEAFDAALDSDVKMLKAFEAIDRLLTEDKEWKELERAYRRMLRRVVENDDGTMENIKLLLWQSLGEIYRSRLGQLKSAIQAFETAVSLKPEDERIRLILAELYDRSDDNPDGAITQHKELIKIDAFRIESYRALWKAYMQKKEYDKAWCMAGALSFLQNANEQEEKFYRQYLGQNLKLANRQFNQEMLKLIYHPKQDMLMTFIMARLGIGLRQFYARDIKDWKLHKKKDILSQDEQLMFTKIYRYSAQTQAIMPAPTLYLHREQALGMRNANVDPAAFVIGGDMMQGKSDRELAFTISRMLCLLRPEHYLASLSYPTEFLRAFFMAMMHVTDPSLNIASTFDESGHAIVKEIQRMPAPILMETGKLMKSYLQKNENPNLSEWLTQVDHTSTRMGLLLCGDIHQAATSIKNDVNAIGKASVKDKIREMVLFSISDEYFQLRQELGLSIENR